MSRAHGRWRSPDRRWSSHARPRRAARMNVLVTGATGFTGGHLARHLLQAGEHVAVLVRPSSVGRAAELAPRGHRDPRGGSHRRCSRGGARSRAASSSFTSPRPTAKPGKAERAYTRVNVDGTRHVLEGALAAGARRVVHCSTGGVHGHIEHPPANEDAPSRPAMCISAPSSRRSSWPWPSARATRSRS